MRTRPVVTAAAILILATAQPAVAADEYVFDPNHTEIRFSWDHLGFSTTSAHFREYSGTLMLEEEDIPNSRIEVMIDTTSIDTGRPDFTEHLRSEDFFHVEEYPQARFVSTDIAARGDDRYTVEGELTLHGVTREVALDMAINRIGESPVTEARTVGFNAETTVSRGEFDMGMYTPAVSDAVDIRISAEMSRRADLD